MLCIATLSERLNRTRKLNSVVCPLHIHPYMEIVVVTNGVLDMEIGKRCYTLEKGEAVFIEAFERHSFCSKQANECIVIEFSIQLHEAFAKWLHTHSTADKKIRLLSPTLEFVLSQIPTKFTVYSQFDTIAMQAFLMPLCHAFMQQCVFEETEKKTDDLFFHTLSYIAEHLQEDLTLVSVAKKLGTRPDSLSRKFIEKCDVGFHHYVQTLRVCRAC